MTEALPDEGVLVNSGAYNGLTSEEARRRLTAEAEARGIGEGTVQFRLKDWGISRPALLGHADPDDPLPAVRRGAGAGRSAARGAAEGGAVHRPRRFAAGQRFRSSSTSPVPPAAAPARRETDTMDTFVDSSWYFYRFADAHNDRLPFDPAKVDVLVPGRLLQRRRRARHPPPDLLALLRARVPRPRHDRPQRAVHAPADPGHGAEGRRGDVEVQGQRRRSRHDARRRSAPMRCAST